MPVYQNILAFKCNTCSYMLIIKEVFVAIKNEQRLLKRYPVYSVLTIVGNAQILLHMLQYKCEAWHKNILYSYIF